MSFADTYCCPNIGVNSSLYTLPFLPFFLFLFLVATRFVVFGDQNWGDLGGLHSNKSRPELTVSRLTARNAIRVATRIVMFLVWPRPELSCVVTRNKTFSSYRNYMPSSHIATWRRKLKLCEEMRLHLQALVKRVISSQFYTFIACAHLCRAANYFFRFSNVLLREDCF